MDELVDEDYLSICISKFSSIPKPLISKIILFNKRMHEETMLNSKFAREGFPWEFNLRDVFRSCEIIEGLLFLFLALLLFCFLFLFPISQESHSLVLQYCFIFYLGAPKYLGEHSFLNIVYIQRMRTEADRKEVLRIFKEVFEVTPFINPYPRVQLNSDNLVVGSVTIKRSHAQPHIASESHLLILPEIRQSLEAAAQCVERQWLCILIGPSSSGKTSLIRLLANLTGNVVNEINLSSATDISELLGSFEQYDALRTFRTVVAQVERYVNEYCSLQLEASKEVIFRERDLHNKWIVFLSGVKFDSLAASASDYFETWQKIICSLSLLAEIIKQLKLIVEKNSLPLSYSTGELDLALQTIQKLEADDQKRLVSTKFEWVTGLLIKAIEQGEWIVLDNANLCNPTVCDACI